MTRKTDIETERPDRTPPEKSGHAGATGGSEQFREAISDIDITEVMRSSYQDYAAAVVVGRAIADVRDGMKPVHRRILYAMKVGGYDWSAGFRKSARIVGDTMGVFHPHGDSAIYEAMARLTQPWSVTIPLVEGQGNFGSPDGDRPAAMRYTEARLARISRFLLEEIDRDTVDFRPNYDETTTEPTVLPAAFPNVLVNGGSGIAVGLASSLPPHNPGEVIDATLKRLREPGCDLDALLACCPGPDFPTGGRIIGDEGIRKAYDTGRGTVTIEASTHFETEGRTPVIVYSDMPWGKTRPDLLARINAMINDSRITDVVSARDETDRRGARFVVELRAGADPEAVDRVLKTQTELRANIGLNFTLLDTRGVPREMGLRDILDDWIGFRRQTIRRRATFDLARARDRGRLLLGRMAALGMIDRIVRMIRKSKDRDEARQAICALIFSAADFNELVALLGTREQKKGKRFRLTPDQADDILDMRLRRLTGMERATLEEEARKLVAEMKDLREILSDPDRLDAVLAEELEKVRGTAGETPRRTAIDAQARVETAPASAPEAPLERTTLLITPDMRLARSRKGCPETMIAHAHDTDTHARVVLFTRDGTAHGLDAATLPDLAAREDPRPAPGLLGLTPSSEIVAAVVLDKTDTAPVADGGAVLAFVSRDGSVRRTPAAEFARIPASGKMAMKIDRSDPRLLSVFRETLEGGAVFMGTAHGRVIRFRLADLRIMAGRSSRGVRGMKLDDDDRIVSALEVADETLSAEICEEIERGWTGRTGRKSLSEDARARLDGPEIIQVAASGHVKRTLTAIYRQTRRDNRGINDRGPARTISEIIGYTQTLSDTDRVALFAGTERSAPVATLTAGEIKRTARAATGAIMLARDLPGPAPGPLDLVVMRNRSPE